MLRLTPRRWRPAAAVTAVLLILGACADAREPAAQTVPATTSPPAAAVAADTRTTPFVHRPVDRVAPAFTLVDQDGNTVSLSDFAGKWVLMDWVFTNCVTFCPLITGEMNAVHRGLGDAVGTDVQFITITFDPQRDTPEALQAYRASATRSTEGWAWLTGTQEQTDAVAAAYGVAYDPAAPVNEIAQFDHTALLVVVGPDGRERHRYLGTGWAEHVLEVLATETAGQQAPETVTAARKTVGSDTTTGVGATDAEQLLESAIALPWEDWELESGVIGQVLYQFPSSGDMVSFIDVLTAEATAGGAEIKRSQLSAMNARLIYWTNDTFSGVGYTNNLAVVVEGESMRAVTDALAVLDDEWCCGTPGA